MSRRNNSISAHKSGVTKVGSDETYSLIVPTWKTVVCPLLSLAVLYQN
jgi:hypothetical protein